MKAWLMWVLLILWRIKLYVQITEPCLSLLKWELFFNNAKRKHRLSLKRAKRRTMVSQGLVLCLCGWCTSFSLKVFFSDEIHAFLHSSSAVLHLGRRKWEIWVPGPEMLEITTSRNICLLARRLSWTIAVASNQVSQAFLFGRGKDLRGLNKYTEEDKGRCNGNHTPMVCQQKGSLTVLLKKGGSQRVATPYKGHCGQYVPFLHIWNMFFFLPFFFFPRDL